jgi:hypothetical protein
MKRILAAALFAAAVSLLLGSPAAAQTTRTLSLSQGDTFTPASRFVDPAGVTTYYGGFVIGQVAGTSPATFTFSLAFQETGLIDSTNGIYSGSIISPNSSFSVSEVSGRKSVSTSGSIDSGTVTYRLTADGRADIISVVSSNLTVWEGRNKRRTAVGHGTLDYGTINEGAGTMVLYF